MRSEVVKEIVLGEGVTATLEGGKLLIKGKSGQLERDFTYPKIAIEVVENVIKLAAKNATKRERTIIGSFQAHIKNMVQGVMEPHVYKLKICSGHFPMNVTVSGQEIIIKNFFGESVPRKVVFKEGVEVKINGQEILISSSNKELAGQTAAKIESTCRIKRKDIRIFQDGCYITEKAGKTI